MADIIALNDLKPPYTLKPGGNFEAANHFATAPGDRGGWGTGKPAETVEYR